MKENNNLQTEVLSEEDMAFKMLSDADYNEVVFANFLLMNQKPIIDYIGQYFLEHKDSIKDKLLERISSHFPQDMKLAEKTKTTTLEDFYKGRLCLDIGETLKDESFNAYMNSSSYQEARWPSPYELIPEVTNSQCVLYDDIYFRATIDVFCYDDLIKLTGTGKMTIGEVFNNANKSISNQVEYNRPIDSKSLLQGIYDRMKSTANDLKDMMNSINKITSKGKAMAQKVLHTEKSEMKSR